MFLKKTGSVLILHLFVAKFAKPNIFEKKTTKYNFYTKNNYPLHNSYGTGISE